MWKKIALIINVLMMITVGSVAVNAQNETGNIISLNISFDKANNSFFLEEALLNESEDVKEKVTLSWVTVTIVPDRAPVFNDYTGDFSNTDDVFLRIKYSFVQEDGININNTKYRLNGGMDRGFNDQSGNQHELMLNDWIRYNELFSNNNNNQNAITGDYLSAALDKDGNLVIINAGPSIFTDYIKDKSIGYSSTDQYNWPDIMDSVGDDFISINGEYGDVFYNVVTNDNVTRRMYTFTPGNQSPEFITIAAEYIKLPSGTYTIGIHAQGKQMISIPDVFIEGSNNNNHNPDIDERYVAFQDQNTGDIIIKAKDGVEDAPSLEEFAMVHMLDYNYGEFDFHDIAPVVGQNCINIFGEKYGDIVFNYKTKDGVEETNIYYDEEKEALIISNDWAIRNLWSGDYTLYLMKERYQTAVNFTARDSSYDVETENAVLRYQFYFGDYYDSTGSLTTSGFGDYVIRTQDATAEELYFGVGSFSKSNNTLTADSIPEQKLFDEIDIKDIYLLCDPGLNVSIKEVTDGKLLERDTKKVTVEFDKYSTGTCYVVVNFTLGESEELHYAYVKLVFSGEENESCIIDLSGMDADQILPMINDIFKSTESLQKTFKNIKPATSPDMSKNIYIDIINIPLDIESVTGDIIWNVSAPKGYDLDHNNYIVNAEGLTIDGSFVSNGNTWLYIGGFNFIKDKSENEIAINPNAGDISVFDCYVEGFEYGFKTHKNGNVRTGFTSEIYNSEFVNCGTAVSLENIKNFTGLNYGTIIAENVIKNCGTAIEIKDLIQGFSAIRSHAITVSNNYFLNNELDFNIAKSSNKEVSTEYYYFPNNYFGAKDEITNKNYRTARVLNESGTVVCTSPALMFPEVKNKQGMIGIDNEAITAMRNGVEYFINTRSKFKGAVTIIFDQETGMPIGRSVLNNFGINNYGVR